MRHGGDLEGPMELYEEIIGRLEPLPSARPSLAVALSEYAVALRLRGDTLGA